MHCYVEPEAIENLDNLAVLAAFCKEMGRETNQGEVGLVIDDEYLGFTRFDKE
jgi:hypothetical protein